MTLTKADYDWVRATVRQRSGIVLEEEKGYLIDSRLAALARREGLGSADEVVRGCRAGGGLAAKLVESLTTNETSFFRDVHPFEALRTDVLPALATRGRPVTVWSAAASTGQEPYTLAMLVREHFPALADGGFRVIATDLSAPVLEQARRGRYTQLEVNRGLPAAYLAKYFRRDGVEWEVREDVRRMVEFSKLNLVEPWPPLPPADVVMIRNVLIYFDVPTKKGILARVRRVLRPGGYLFLGGAETTTGLDDGFERVSLPRTTYYRLGPAGGK